MQSAEASVLQYPEVLHLHGKDLDNNNPDMSTDDIYADLQATETQAKQVNGKGKKERRRNKAGPKSRKAKGSRNSQNVVSDMLDYGDDGLGDEALGLFLDDSASEMNESVDSCLKNANGHEDELITNGTLEVNGVPNDVNGENVEELKELEEKAMPEETREDDLEMSNNDSVTEDAPEDIEDLSMANCLDATDDELKADVSLNLADQTAVLMEVQVSPSAVCFESPKEVQEDSLEQDEQTSSEEDVLFTTESGTSSNALNTNTGGVLSEEILRAPFVRYLSTVSARPPIHSTYPDSTYPSYSSFGKRKAEDQEEETQTKKIKSEEGFFSKLASPLFNRLRRIGRKSDENLMPEGREGSNLTGEEVYGTEELPVLPDAEEPRKWCSVM